MASDLRHAELPHLMAEADVIAATARQEFGALTRAQWNWKPAAREWSIGQRLHLRQARAVAAAAGFP